MQKIGILGAGQLGQMLALSGYPLGNRFAFLDTTRSPSAAIGEIFDYHSPQWTQFLQDIDVITFEFEHLPLDLVRQLAEQHSVLPNVRCLEICQHRAKEKQLFDQLNIPVPPYFIVKSGTELQQAVVALMHQGAVAVVAKTVTEGYDGKGQQVIRDAETALEVWEQMDHNELIVEAFVDFSREVSMIAVRDIHGNQVAYPLVENHHHNGILRYSLAPAPFLSAQTQRSAQEYISVLLQSLDYVGVLTLELFEMPDGRLLANEMAPRVHNSGHWSQNGCQTSQFENHLRAIQGLPLGSTQVTQPTCMINIIGQLGNLEDILAFSGAHVHLYGKEERPNRKLGHINVTAKSHEQLYARVQQIAEVLPDAPPPQFLHFNNEDRSKL